MSDDTTGLDELERLQEDRRRHRAAPPAEPHGMARPAPNGAHAAPELPRLTTVHPPTLAGRQAPERRWLVPQLVPIGHVTLLYGDGGIGKSLLAQQLMTSCATGRPWLGLEVERCRALGVFCEDEDEELWRRQEAINACYGIDMHALEDMEWSSWLKEPETLLMTWQFPEQPPQMMPQLARLRDLVADVKPQLIVLDSLYDLFGGNENIKQHAKGFIRILSVLAGEIDGAVVLNAHPSVEGMKSRSGTSGSVGWNAAARSRLFFELPQADGDSQPDPTERVLRGMKANYAARGGEIKATWRDGAFQADTDFSGGIWGAQAKETADRVFLELLEAFRRQGRNVCHKPKAGNFAPVAFAAAGVPNQGLRRNELKAAMNRLFEAGVIAVKEYGPPSRLAERIERVPEREPELGLEE